MSQRVDGIRGLEDKGIMHEEDLKLRNETKEVGC